MRHEHGIFAALLLDRNAHGAGGICTRNALAARSALGERRIALIHLLASLVYVRLNMTPNIFLRVRIPRALPGPLAEHASRILPGPLGATAYTRP